MLIAYLYPDQLRQPRRDELQLELRHVRPTAAAVPSSPSTAAAAATAAAATAAAATAAATAPGQGQHPAGGARVPGGDGGGVLQRHHRQPRRQPRPVQVGAHLHHLHGHQVVYNLRLNDILWA